MDKFYVQSGNFRSVVQAESNRKAALWAVHRVMRQVLPIDQDDADVRPGAAPPDLEVTEADCLASEISVSNRGFDRSDAVQLATMDVVSDWNQMVVTLERLEKMLYRAA